MYLHDTGFQALEIIETGGRDYCPHLLVISGEDFLSEKTPPVDEEAEVSEFEYLVLDIMHIITCLYRFSIAIQNPAPKERLDKIALINVSHFENWDIKHINEKFHPVDPLNDFRVANYLSERLGKANTRRRQLLEYYQAHHKKISGCIDDPPSSKSVSELTNAPQPVAPTTESGSARAPAETPHLERAAPFCTTTMPQSTVFTVKDELHQGAIQIDRDEDQTSYALTINHRMGIRVPSPPDENAAYAGVPFECPYCFTITKIRDRQDWKCVDPSTSICIVC